MKEILKSKKEVLPGQGTGELGRRVRFGERQLKDELGEREQKPGEAGLIGSIKIWILSQRQEGTSRGLSPDPVWAVSFSICNMENGFGESIN